MPFAARRLVYTGSGAALELHNISNFTIRDVTFSGISATGTPTGENGLKFTASAETNLIDSCSFENFTNSGVRFEGGTSDFVSSNTIQHSTFVNNGGVQLYANVFADYFIDGNQFGQGARHVGSYGVDLRSAGPGTYTRNYLWGNDIGLRLVGNFNRIENNRFEQSYLEGVLLEGPATGWPYSMLDIMTGNTIHTNSNAGSGLTPAAHRC